MPWTQIATLKGADGGLRRLTLPCIAVRLGQGTVYRPSFVEATVDNVSFNSHASCPVRETHCFTEVSDIPRVLPISGLFSRGRPSTVFRRVRAVVVDAVNAVRVGWARSHIFKECLKRVPPTITYGNAPRAVVLERLVFRVATAPDDAMPNPVFRQVASSMSAISIREFIRVVTAATYAMSPFQVFGSYASLFPAIAPTQPPRSVFSITSNRLDYDQTSKPLALERNTPSHTTTGIGAEPRYSFCALSEELRTAHFTRTLNEHRNRLLDRLIEVSRPGRFQPLRVISRSLILPDSLAVMGFLPVNRRGSNALG